MRYSAEDADDDEGHDCGAKDRLQEDGILDLAQGRLLDPDFSVKDLADDVALFVFGDPWLVLVAVAGSVRWQTVKRITFQIDASSRLIFGGEQLPRT